MAKKLRMLACLLVLISNFSCARDSQKSSDVKFMQGALRGHEDITRWSIAIADQALAANQSRIRYPDVTDGDRGNNTTNPFLRGSFATDFPQKVREFSLSSYYGVGPDVDFTYAPQFQDLHFLRDYQGRVVESAKSTCLKSRQRIIGATYTALQTSKTQIWLSQFFVGHVLHTIQDSFSEAHTQRSGDFRQLLDICTYGVDAPGVCRHENVALVKDSVWISNFCDKSEWGCMKPSAQYAAYAGAGYLKVFSQMMESNLAVDINVIATVLNPYFDNSNGWNSGYFNCDSLSGADQYSW